MSKNYAVLFIFFVLIRKNILLFYLYIRYSKNLYNSKYLIKK